MLYKKNKFSKKITVFLFIVLAAVIFFVAQNALAQSIELEALQATGLGNESLVVIIARIIQIFLGLIGIVALGIILYAGFLWMTSGGNAEKVEKAKKIIVNAVIGLVIILASWAIVTFLIQQIILSTNQGGGGGGLGTIQPPGSAIGGGIIESVYPLPGSLNNPRNTFIQVTFKEEVQDIIEGNGLQGQLAGDNSNPNVQIYQSDNPNDPLDADQVNVLTSDNKTFVFDPVPDLGSSTEPTTYTVTLTSNILKVSNNQAALPTGFDWSFGIGTFLDNTPPQVISVYPVAGSTVARNVIIQINFSEAINAASATGITLPGGTGFNNITTIDRTNQIIPGEYTISNQYKTVEFLSSLDCGIGQTINSCGNPVYCLPANQDFEVTAKADTIPFTLAGITDAAGNSLDGDSDGVAEGPPTDNYVWNFSTNDELDLTPPVLVALDPQDEETNIPLNTEVIAEFNEAISGSSVNTTNYILLYDDIACTDSDPQVAQPDQFGQYPNMPSWCWPGGFGAEVQNSNQARLWTYGNLESFNRYNPRVLSYVQDMYQNCFSPSIGP